MKPHDHEDILKLFHNLVNTLHHLDGINDQYRKVRWEMSVDYETPHQRAVRLFQHNTIGEFENSIKEITQAAHEHIKLHQMP